MRHVGRGPGGGTEVGGAFAGASNGHAYREPGAGWGRLASVTDRLADTAEVRKARGAFFTPPGLAAYVTEWALRSADDHVLEPSCGEAAFLGAALDRLVELGNGTLAATARLDGVEVHEWSAQVARDLLRNAGDSASILVSDFFDLPPAPLYDAVVGNPPYVRYQDFAGEPRTRSREAALRAGVSLTRLASSWAAFTVHASLFLKPGGRLGLVLPAELLTVNYAAEVRRFLMERFSRVDLVMFEERVFPGVLEEVVLLMADGYGDGPTDHCRVLQARNVEALATPALPRLWRPDQPGSKWTPSLLAPDVLDAYAMVVEGGHFATLDAWGATTLGMVTGNNRFFALSAERVAELGLRQSDLVRLSPPGSRHLRGLSFTASAWEEMRRAGAATWLFRPSDEPSPEGLAYIAAGEATNVHQAYKCRVRRPWWRVPLLRPADLLLTYMNADTPRLCTNRSAVHHLNSVHGLYLKPGLRRIGMDLLPVAALNSMTLLGAETVGRAYGGGMLKIEPKEADRLPVPSVALVEAARNALSNLRPQMAALLRAGRLGEAARLVDGVLLVGELGMTRSQVRALREGHARLTARRVARGSAPRGSR